MNSDSGERLTARFVWKEIVAFLAWEKGSPHTATLLCMSPGKTIHAYLDGQREQLTNPIRFLLLTCAIVTTVYLFSLPRYAFQNSVESPLQGSGWDSVQPEMMEKLNQTRSLLAEIRDKAEQKFLRRDAQQALETLEQTRMSQMAEISLTWMNVFLLFGLPINAIISWLFFRSANLNLTEHIAANAYIMGVQNLGAVFTVPLLYLGWIDFGRIALLYMLLSFIYQFVAWKQTFAIRGVFRYALGLFAIVLSMIGYVFVQAIAIAVIYGLTA
ncbi:MAG: DUF3667 domain-containing protein [Pirellulaceae bacterium]|nr:DUF3667 domain-containing protein [Pirellulaceae bacterium]